MHIWIIAPERAPSSLLLVATTGQPRPRCGRKGATKEPNNISTVYNICLSAEVNAFYYYRYIIIITIVVLVLVLACALV